VDILSASQALEAAIHASTPADAAHALGVVAAELGWAQNYLVAAAQAYGPQPWARLADHVGVLQQQASAWATQAQGLSADALPAFQQQTLYPFQGALGQLADTLRARAWLLLGGAAGAVSGAAVVVLASGAALTVYGLIRGIRWLRQRAYRSR